MAKLMDLEELLHEVKNRELVPNLREAIACYHASSFRACIILSFNALVDDLLIKLSHYKEISKDAKVIYNNVSHLIEMQASFENPLIEQLVSAKIFTELEGELYTTFQKFRHKSAHPSGYTPTAECARFVYTEVIRSFLSKESLQTTDRIESLISDIIEDNFFTSTNVNERAELVKSEISNIHPDAIPQLISKVYKKSFEVDSRNGGLYHGFINAMFAIDSPKINELIISIVIKKNISKAGQSFLFTSVMATNPAALSHIDEVLARKLVINLKERIQSAPKNIGKTTLANPYYAIYKILNFCEGHLNRLVIGILDEFVENPERLCYFLLKIDKSEDSIGRKSYIELISVIIKSITMDEPDKIDKLLTSFIDDDSAALKLVAPFRLFEIICAIILNKKKSRVANEMVSDGFEQIHYAIEKTKDFYLAKKFTKSSLYHKFSDDMKIRIDEIYV